MPFLLHLPKGQPVDDGGMTVLHVVLGELTGVFLGLAGEKVHDVGFLDRQAPMYFFVSKHPVSRRHSTFYAPRHFDAVRLKVCDDFGYAVPNQIP